MEAGGWRDEDLAAVLDTVSLGHILTREGGWDAAADWKVTIITVSGNYPHYLSTFVNESWTISRNVVSTLELQTKVAEEYMFYNHRNGHPYKRFHI